jgi:two-component system, OmpR family, sensor histidine kinase ChvG
VSWWIRGEWRASGIALRLLAFNVLVVFVPIVGVLYLDVYEERLLDLQERAMVQQARVLAAAVGGAPAIDASGARATLQRVGGRNDARLRVFDRRGALIADSLGAAEGQPQDAARSRSDLPAPDIRSRSLYRAGAALQAIRNSLASHAPWRKDMRVPAAGGERVAQGEDAEVAAALAGRYGASTRPTRGQRSLTLYSAIPVRNADAVIGAVVVSQSTFRILQALYDVRLRIFRVVLASMAVAAGLTTLAATTIVRPLARLRRAAASLAERRSPLLSPFPGIRRRDEVGDLARALDDLTHRLSAHIALLEGFAADVAHEFRNPLAGIRTAAERLRHAKTLGNAAVSPRS